jgi:hypothetical protein
MSSSNAVGPSFAVLRDDVVELYRSAFSNLLLAL